MASLIRLFESEVQAARKSQAVAGALGSTVLVNDNFCINGSFIVEIYTI
jgi:hypothetical protein